MLLLLLIIIIVSVIVTVIINVLVWSGQEKYEVEVKFR